MSSSPAISVVLPVYNAEAYVREAVGSILAQSFTDFELIAINDGSTDDSGAILCLESNAGNRIKIFVEVISSRISWHRVMHSKQE